MTRARIDPSTWIRRLGDAIELTLEGSDPEGVHQVRAAARRLRVWLELGGHTALTEDLRHLCRALGPLRDLHLLGELPELRSWHDQRAQAELHQVVRLLRSPRTVGLLEALSAMEWPSAHDAQKRLRRYHQRVKASLKAYRHAARTERFAAAHRLRRDARALRFALDWLGRDSLSAHHLTAALGDVCDAVALSRVLGQWAASEHQTVELSKVLEQLDRSTLAALPG